MSIIISYNKLLLYLILKLKRKDVNFNHPEGSFLAESSVNPTISVNRIATSRSLELSLSSVPSDFSISFLISGEKYRPKTALALSVFFYRRDYRLKKEKDYKKPYCKKTQYNNIIPQKK